MNLIISGIALSYQWWPSLTHFEECLPGKRKSFPALVEEAGEVILQALADARPAQRSKLTILYNPAQIELGNFLPLIKDEYSSVDQERAGGEGLLSKIRQAASLIQAEADRQVLVCEISSFGSAAVVFSSALEMSPGWARIKSPGLPGVDPSLADYVLIPDNITSRQEESAALLEAVFCSREGEHPASVGYGSSRSTEILSLIQAVLALKHKIIPASSRDADPMISRLKGLPVHAIRDFRPWLSRAPGSVRSSLLFLADPPQNQVDLLVLEEILEAEDHLGVRIVPGSDPYLIPVSGSTESEIQQRLLDLESLASSKETLGSIADNAYAKFSGQQGTYVLSLLVGDREQLEKELSHAKTGLALAFQTGQAWTSPNGSYFTPSPLGKEPIAFVYPGAFNSYPGMAKEIFFSFPGLENAASLIIPDLSHSLAEEFTFLRPSRSDADDSMERIMEDFYRHPNQLIESGISLSVLHTMILDRIFNLRPDAALGYSLGEISMLWANQVWQNAKDRSDSWKQSTLFKDELVGEMKTVRRYWHDIDLEDDFWRSFILKTDPEKAKNACAQEKLVFLSIENSGDEVVIVGEAAACQRVIQGLGCRSLPMPFNAVIHNPAMEACQPAFAELYHNQTNPRTDINFYSAAHYQKLDLEKDDLAQTMARMTCSPFDFPRLVNQVYNDGARIFIEIGPQKTCSRWIEKILKDKPHAVIPINKKYQPDLHGVLKVIALLLSHQADINLSGLYPAAEKQPAAKNWPVKSSRQKNKGRMGSTAARPDSRGLERIPPPLVGTYFHHLDQISSDQAKSHQEFLRNQKTLIRNLSRLMQMRSISTQAELVEPVEKPALYTRSQIQAFTKGDHRICFGDTFSGFKDRRIPRLPNGDLQFIDRVLSIDGPRDRVAEGSALTSEFDLPDQGWYLNGTPGSIPLVSIMEMALQPCGFLSAYMGSIKGRENQDLYFRNLDGEASLVQWPSGPGRTLTNHVRLISSSALEDVIIQSYEFELAWGGQPFYRGRSSFGYFPQAMLENQSGLDGGKYKVPWREDNPQAGSWMEGRQPSPNLLASPKAKLPEIGPVWISPAGGRHAAGYVYSRHPLKDDAWFYQAHFYQDPVMPGSLGIESMARVLMASAAAWGAPVNGKWKLKPNVKTSWKYRGQITPGTDDFEIELHIKKLSNTSGGWEISADGLLWKDSKPIYLVEDLSLTT